MVNRFAGKFLSLYQILLVLLQYPTWPRGSRLSYFIWPLRDFSSPSPHYIKQRILLKNSIPGGIWIETGTYLGETTKFLAKHGFTIYSVEPQHDLFKKARDKLKNFSNVVLIEGLSEDVLPQLLSRLEGNINFWLDGHYSAGVTFKGPLETPILEELNTIKSNLNNFNNLCIMIDDVRIFNPEINPTYPSIDVIVDWARSNSFTWKIEHDIFIAKN